MPSSAKEPAAPGVTASAEADASLPVPPLLKLPRNLRVRIWVIYMRDEKRLRDFSNFLVGPPILRQIRREALSVFFLRCNFRVKVSSNIVEWHSYLRRSFPERWVQFLRGRPEESRTDIQPRFMEWLNQSDVQPYAFFSNIIFQVHPYGLDHLEFNRLGDEDVQISTDGQHLRLSEVTPVERTSNEGKEYLKAHKTLEKKAHDIVMQRQNFDGFSIDDILELAKTYWYEF
ncbi:hypothetical protein TruAng_004043 [Truncatella angustata]|nr:hypothetical protein TruAng_004043 [Truncatella angustata]